MNKLKTDVSTKRFLAGIVLLIVAAGLIAPALGIMKFFQAGPVSMQIDSLAIYNQLLVCLAMGLGYILRHLQPNFKNVWLFWSLGVICTFLFELGTAIANPADFHLQAIFRVLFPVANGLSALFSFIIIALLLAPFLLNLEQRLQNINVILLLAALLVFSATGFVKISSHNLIALELLVPFAYGLTYHPHKDPKHKILNLLLGILLLGILIWLTNIICETAVLANAQIKISSLEFLIVCSSPLQILTAGLFISAFSNVLSAMKLTDCLILVPACLLGAKDLSKIVRYNAQAHFFAIGKFQLLLEILILVVIAAIVAFVFLVLSRIAHLHSLAMFFDGQNYDDLQTICQRLLTNTKSWGRRHRTSLFTWLYLFFLSIASILIANDGGDINGRPFIFYFLANKHWIPVLTTLFLSALFAILYFICTRYWTALALTSALTVGWSIAEREKLLLRGEPIYVSEIREIANWKTLLPMVNKALLISVGIGLLVLIVMVLLLELKRPIKLAKFRTRLLWAFLSLALLITPVWFNDQSSPIYYVSLAFDNKATFSNPAYDLQLKGPVLTFLDYANVKVMQKPQNYTDQHLKTIIQRYDKTAKKINRTRQHKLKQQTIVFNLSESFVDPKDFPKSKITAGNPLVFINSLQRNYTYGHMLSAGYGGGTANMEYESLTGFNMAGFNGQVMPYLQVVPKFKHYPNIGQQFSYASAIHPFNGGYYGRKSVYKIFGFNKFAYLGSKDKIIAQKRAGSDWYLSDQTLYTNGLRQIRARKQGQFINLISIQNHTPYMDWYPDNQYHGHAAVNLPLVDGVKKQNYSNYVKGTEYTDRAVKHFIERIDTIQKPIYFVFYGDHYPSIINQNMLKKYPIRLHETTYFIYANRYARTHGAKAKIRKSDVVTTSDFIPMVLEQSNSKVTPYQALLTKIHQELPAITINYQGNKGMELVDQKGREIKLNTLNKKQKQLLQDYVCVQYDMTAGQGYSQRIKGFYR